MFKRSHYYRKYFRNCFAGSNSKTTDIQNFIKFSSYSGYGRSSSFSNIQQQNHLDNDIPARYSLIGIISLTKVELSRSGNFSRLLSKVI